MFKSNKFLVLLINLSLWQTGYSRDTRSTLDKAKIVIKNIDYIPFSSIQDGCYSRALYMGMELAIHGIPSTNQYIFGSLNPTDDISWQYHVAPMIAVEGSVKFAIFDPSFHRQPMTREQWQRYNRPEGNTEMYVAPASHYRKGQVQSSYQQRLRGFSIDSRFKKVKEFPRYRMDHIADACKTAWTHIGKEKELTSFEKSRKRDRLKNRTNYLIGRLKDLHILKEDAWLLSCQTGDYDG